MQQHDEIWGNIQSKKPDKSFTLLTFIGSSKTSKTNVWWQIKRLVTLREMTRIQEGDFEGKDNNLCFDCVAQGGFTL